MSDDSMSCDDDVEIISFQYDVLQVIDGEVVEPRVIPADQMEEMFLAAEMKKMVVEPIALPKTTIEELTAEIEKLGDVAEIADTTNIDKLSDIEVEVGNIIMTCVKCRTDLEAKLLEGEAEVIFNYVEPKSTKQTNFLGGIIQAIAVKTDKEQISDVEWNDLLGTNLRIISEVPSDWTMLLMDVSYELGTIALCVNPENPSWQKHLDAIIKLTNNTAVSHFTEKKIQEMAVMNLLSKVRELTGMRYIYSWNRPDDNGNIYSSMMLSAVSFSEPIEIYGGPITRYST